MRKKNTNVKKLVLAALFIAIIIVMTAVPYTGYIEYVPGGINMTTLHIPVIIGAVFLGWKYGALLGCVWGVTCVVKAFLTPGPGNVPFQNPMISVLPRIIVGIVAGLVFALVSGRFGKKPVVAGTHPKRSRRCRRCGNAHEHRARAHDASLLRRTRHNGHCAGVFNCPQDHCRN